MFNNTGYGGDQGGGYMDTTSNNFNSSQAGGSGERKRQKPTTTLPCTVAQILNSQQVDDKFMIDNVELHQVTVVGIVRSVKESSTRIEYFVDDMTAQPLDVRQFVDNDESTPDEDRVLAFRENMYIRIHGHVRSFQGKHHVMAFKIIPVTDMNELTTHMLEVIHSHLALTRGAVAAGGGSGMAGPSGQQVSYSNDSSMYQGGGGGGDPGLNPLQNMVHQTISRCNDEQGVSISFICDKLRGQTQANIREAVEFLSSEGHIYSTIDDDHFKSTESM